MGRFEVLQTMRPPGWGNEPSEGLPWGYVYRDRDGEVWMVEHVGDCVWDVLLLDYWPLDRYANDETVASNGTGMGRVHISVKNRAWPTARQVHAAFLWGQRAADRRAA